MIIFDGPPIRLDKYLSEQFPDIPRRFFQMQIDNGNILINDNQKPAGYRLKQGDSISIHLTYTPRREIVLEPEPDIQLEVLFQSDDFFVINKPAGISVHPSDPEPAGTVVNGMIARYPELVGIGESPIRPGIVHRLDKDTSGVMVIARTQTSFTAFKKMFQQHQIEKTYQALVWGSLTKKQGVIRSWIGRSKKNPLKQQSTQNPALVSNPKEAVTHYRVIKEFPESSLIECRTETGRKHQIRVHLHSIGHPLVGDHKYALKSVKVKNVSFPRHRLHAAALQFTYQGKSYEFKSNLPPDFFHV